MQMVMTSDETQIQIFTDYFMSNAKRVTRGNWKNLEYHAAEKKSWPNHILHYLLHLADKTTLALFRTEASKIVYPVQDSKAKKTYPVQWHVSGSIAQIREYPPGTSPGG